MSCACEVWAVSPSVSKAAEELPRGFIEHLWGVGMFTAGETYYLHVRLWPFPIACTLLAADFALSSQSSSNTQFLPCQPCNGECLHFRGQLALSQQQQTRLAVSRKIVLGATFTAAFFTVLTLHLLDALALRLRFSITVALFCVEVGSLILLCTTSSCS